MQADRTSRDQLDLRGNPVLDAHGKAVGTVSAIVLDEWTGRPAWIEIDRGASREPLVVDSGDCSTVRSGSTLALVLRATAPLRAAAGIAG